MVTKTQRQQLTECYEKWEFCPVCGDNLRHPVNQQYHKDGICLRQFQKDLDTDRRVEAWMEFREWKREVRYVD